MTSAGVAGRLKPLQQLPEVRLRGLLTRPHRPPLRLLDPQQERHSPSGPEADPMSWQMQQSRPGSPRRRTSGRCCRVSGLPILKLHSCNNLPLSVPACCRLLLSVCKSRRRTQAADRRGRLRQGAPHRLPGPLRRRKVNVDVYLSASCPTWCRKFFLHLWRKRPAAGVNESRRASRRGSRVSGGQSQAVLVHFIQLCRPFLLTGCDASRAAGRSYGDEAQPAAGALAGHAQARARRPATLPEGVAEAFVAFSSATRRVAGSRACSYVRGRGPGG
jgi:hypothetical protein